MGKALTGELSCPVTGLVVTPGINRRETSITFFGSGIGYELTYEIQPFFYESRALDKGEYLVIIRDNFC